MIGSMRWLAVLALAGCGRLGFAPEGDAATTPDGWPDVPPGCVGPDEDGDGWPNACDNCVTEPNPDQADRGELAVGAPADGVGDACDPRPGVTGDYVALAAFHDDPNATAYALYNTWSYPGNGALRLGAVAGLGSATYVAAEPVTRVDCGYTIIDASTSEIQWTGVWGEQGSDSIFLEAARDPDGATTLFRIKEQRMGGAMSRYSTDIEGPAQFSVGQRYRVIGDSALVTGSEFELAVTDRALGITKRTSMALQVPWAGGGYIEANRMVVDFEYLVVYAIR